MSVDIAVECNKLKAFLLLLSVVFVIVVINSSK